MLIECAFVAATMWGPWESKAPMKINRCQIAYTVQRKDHCTVVYPGRENVSINERCSTIDGSEDTFVDVQSDHRLPIEKDTGKPVSIPPNLFPPK
jgi:hypothetical protein